MVLPSGDSEGTLIHDFVTEPDVPFVQHFYLLQKLHTDTIKMYLYIQQALLISGLEVAIIMSI